MTSSIGMRELRNQTSAVLRRVVAGEVIEVTKHGHPVARIVPLQQSALAELAAEGSATAAESDLLEGLSLQSLSAGNVSASGALSEQRADER